MPARALTPTPQTYAQLRAAVIAVVVHGRRAIDRAWLETYHETGRLINEHVLLFRDRADYGAKVYERLSADTQISVRTLRQCAQFQRCYPIRHARAELSWGHYQRLIQVDDDARRRALEAEATQQGWSTRDLETHVRAYNAIALAADDAAPASPVELLSPRCGVPGLRRVVERPDGLGIDLGFKNYADLGFASKSKTPGKVEGLKVGRFDRLTAGDIVRWEEDGVQKIADATPAQLFTYRATVRKIVDGDTLDIALTLAPGFTRDLKLRLRGLDCPEIATAAGRAAKAFVEKLLAPGDEVIVCTTKPDKYDRYLADVFVRQELKGESTKLKDGARDQPSTGSDLQHSSFNLQLGDHSTAAFLNNALLASRHAVRYDGGAKEE